MEVNQNRSNVQTTIGLLSDPQSKLRRLRTSKKHSSTFTESKEKEKMGSPLPKQWEHGDQ
jgi:hypothetical protein